MTRELTLSRDESVDVWNALDRWIRDIEKPSNSDYRLTSNYQHHMGLKALKLRIKLQMDLGE